MTTTPVPIVRITARRVLIAEWIKLRGVRSTWWLVGGSVASLVAAGVSPAVTVLAGATPEKGIDATGGALGGVSFTQLLVAALGVLAVSSEYASGQIRTTFTAVPSRLPVLAGKAATVAGLVGASALAAVVASFLVAQAVLSSAGISVSLSTPGVLRAVVGAALLLALSAVLGAGFGWLVRSTAGALALTAVFLFVLQLLTLLAPSIGPYLPGNAGAAVLQVEPAQGVLPPWTGLGLFAGYTAVVLVAAGVLLRRRDA
jgi:ABC-2 type transport system permease protein